MTRSDGAKMGKTESGTLWLSAEKTSPYQFYQYWINLDDADVGRCLRFFTDLIREEIDAVLAQHEADPGRRGAQRRLAIELTQLVHGLEGLQTAERATEIFFGAEISELDDLVESGLSKSKGDARRTISQGGAYINNRRVEGVETTLTAANLASETTLILRSGKKNYALLRFV